MASLALRQTPVCGAAHASTRTLRRGCAWRMSSGTSPCTSPSQCSPSSQHTWQEAHTGPCSRRSLVVVCSQAGGRTTGGKKKSTKMVDINGEVTKDLGNGMFQVKLDNGVSVMAYLSGRIQQNRIKVVMGDKVTVELSPYDLTKGRITYRFKPGEVEGAAAAAQ